MSNGKDFLVIEDLTVTFSRWGQTVKALDGVSISVPRGQWLTVAGHNGSGKSTLLQVMSGRIVPDKGRALIGGQDISALRPAGLAANVFHVHQTPLLGTAPALTVFENLLVADHDAQLRSESKRSLTEKYGELLAPLGLSGRMKQPAGSLSGGERQILALLIARLRPSSLILLDEPLTALDPMNSEMCLRQIEELNRLGKTLIQVTHNSEHARTLGDRTLVLREGRVIYDGVGQSRALGITDENGLERVLIGG